MKLQFGSKTGTMIDRRSMVQIRGKVQCICGIDAYYRLYEVRRAGLRSYAVNISYGRDSVSKKLGFRRDEACRVFEKLVEGYVTPTTLGDIVTTSRANAAARSDTTFCVKKRQSPLQVA